MPVAAVPAVAHLVPPVTALAHTNETKAHPRIEHRQETKCLRYPLWAKSGLLQCTSACLLGPIADITRGDDTPVYQTWSCSLGDPWRCPFNSASQPRKKLVAQSRACLLCSEYSS